MVHASGHINKRSKHSHVKKEIEHIPCHILVKQHSNSLCNEKMKMSTSRSSDFCITKEFGNNIRSSNKEASIIVPQTDNNWILKSSADVLHKFDQTAKPVNVLCCIFQSQDVVCISINNCTDLVLFPEVSTELDFYINKLTPMQECRKQELIFSNQYLNNDKFSPKLMLESKNSRVTIFELLPYIRAMCEHVLTEKQQRYVIQGKTVQATPSSSLKPDRISRKIILRNELRATDDVLKSKNIIKQNSIGKNKLFKPIPVQIQIKSCLHIFNKILTDSTRNEPCRQCDNIVPSIYFHNWHFKSLTQGYILKCILMKGRTTALNFMRNLYFIIITKLPPSSKIDIFFELHDGTFSVLNENYINRVSQYLVLNIDSTDTLVDNMDVNEDNKDDIQNLQEVSKEESDCCSSNVDEGSSTLSLYSVPGYPSESTLFIEEEIKSWYKLSDETPDFETKINDCFTSSGPKEEMYVNFWCNIYELAKVLNNLKRNTSDIVYCYTTEMLSTYEIFNENLFQGKSFDSLFNQDLRKFGTTFLQTLGKSLAYTMFSHVL